MHRFSLLFSFICNSRLFWPQRERSLQRALTSHASPTDPNAVLTDGQGTRTRCMCVLWRIYASDAVLIACQQINCLKPQLIDATKKKIDQEKHFSSLKIASDAHLHNLLFYLNLSSQMSLNHCRCLAGMETFRPPVYVCVCVWASLRFFQSMPIDMHRRHKGWDFSNMIVSQVPLCQSRPNRGHFPLERSNRARWKPKQKTIQSNNGLLWMALPQTIMWRQLNRFSTYAISRRIRFWNTFGIEN